MKWVVACLITVLLVGIVSAAMLKGTNFFVYGDLDVEKNFTGNQIYGGMFYHNHTGTSINFDVQSTYYPLWFVNASSLNGVSFVGGFNKSSNLTIRVAGKYLVNYMASGNGVNTHEYYTTVFLNDTEIDNCENHHSDSAGIDIITQTGSCLVNFGVGDMVNLRVTDISGTGVGTYYSANINLVRIGD